MTHDPQIVRAKENLKLNYGVYHKDRGQFPIQSAQILTACG